MNDTLSTNIRKLGRVSDHDIAVKTDAPKITLIHIHDPHTSLHHCPQGESTGTEICVSTRMILDQVDDQYPHEMIHILDPYSYVPHTRTVVPFPSTEKIQNGSLVSRSMELD